MFEMFIGYPTIYNPTIHCAANSPFVLEELLIYDTMSDEQKPYEQELDGYGEGLINTNLSKKNTSKNKYKGSGYEWIRKTLKRVDIINHAEYFMNFQTHKVEDDRLGDLLDEDWKELIPAIGPRNDFKRLWRMKFGEKHLFEYQFQYDPETTTVSNRSELQSDYTDDIPQHLQHELLHHLSDESTDNSDHAKPAFLHYTNNVNQISLDLKEDKKNLLLTDDKVINSTNSIQKKEKKTNCTMIK